MANWRYTIRGVKDALDDRRKLRDVKADVVGALRQSREYATSPELQAVTGRIAKAGTVTTFDRALDALYDWADANLVWVE